MARSDSVRTRQRLLEAAEKLLRVDGVGFSMPDVARAAEVSITSVYRHFENVTDLCNAYHASRISELSGVFETARSDLRGFALYQRVCHEWVDHSSEWAASVVHIRSPQGFLVRVRDGEPVTSQLFNVLASVVEMLIDDGVIPPQNTELAILTWITLFDERVLLDLELTLGWSSDMIADHLAQRVLAALRVPIDVFRPEQVATVKTAS